MRADRLLGSASQGVGCFTISTMTQATEQVPYFPNRAQYEAQTFGCSKTTPDKALPGGFSKKLSSDMVWEGKDISLEGGASNGAPYVLVLPDTQLVEIDAALRYFQTLNQPLEALRPSTFPLPSLHSILRSASDNLHSHYGFTLVRGVPVDQYDREENMIIYVGISSHIAAIRGRQDHQFEGKLADVMVAHVTDMRRSPDDKKDFALAAYSDGEVVFHTDVGDIVSLFVLSEPASGGECLLASGWRVYNALADTRPDLVRVLAADWPIPSAQQPGLVKRRPLLFYQPPSDNAPERVIFQFSRRSFSGFGALSQTNMLTAIQVEALDALHFLAEKFHVSMKLQKGDMQFVNNLSMIHARNSYLDDADHRRHLLRLWLRDPINAWETPRSLRDRWDRIYGLEAVPSCRLQLFPLEPVARSFVASITAHLEPSKHTFHFINGPYSSSPAAGLDLRYPDGPYYTWWQQATVSNIRAACQSLHLYFLEHRHDPYDGVVCFSRGCLLVASYIWFHQIKQPAQSLPFKAAMFVCGGPVLSVLEELGMTITDKAQEWDRRTKLALRERASKAAIEKWGKDRWLTPGGNGDSDLHLDPSAPIDPSDVFGLDIINMPQQLRIGIPTLHVYGRVDPRLPASLQLAHLSEATTRLTYRHEGGHNIPRSSVAAEGIARVMDECAQLVVDLDAR
ncbi:hypothetical protein N7448_011086 [Penicillium atrosanguineum]|nr:hypothetical protein N7448_011086 [Penicillium atrosanguineum]